MQKLTLRTPYYSSRVLVLLGSASHSITQERQKVAWSRINPTTVHLLTEDTEGERKETTLFGSGFLERAAKVAGARHRGGLPRSASNQDKTLMTYDAFWRKGAPAKYGGRNPQRQQPYRQQRPFQKSRKGKDKKPHNREWNKQ